MLIPRPLARQKITPLLARLRAAWMLAGWGVRLEVRKVPSMSQATRRISRMGRGYQICGEVRMMQVKMRVVWADI